jgi:hypothetical protein
MKKYISIPFVQLFINRIHYKIIGEYIKYVISI